MCFPVRPPAAELRVLPGPPAGKRNADALQIARNGAKTIDSLKNMVYAKDVLQTKVF
jgi:hypothetical protein